jgi:hypothetical protein
VTVALMLGIGATAACSDGTAAPVAPSPGLDTGLVSRAGPSPAPSTTITELDRNQPGIWLTAVPRSDGSFDVIEDVLLPKATDILQLSLPSSGEHLPGMMVKTDPQATDLKVTADNRPVPLQQTSITGPEDLPLTTAARKLHLTYRLSGSVVRSGPPRPQRAGAAIRPLSSPAEGTIPTTVTVTHGLLNAVCPLLSETRCAIGDPPNLGIQPNIPAGKALVVLQLDLPE